MRKLSTSGSTTLPAQSSESLIWHCQPSSLRLPRLLSFLSNDNKRDSASISINIRTKPALLLIHGICQSRFCWDRQFENEDLDAQYYMIRLDLREHGLSDKSTDPTAYQNGKIWADDIQAVISALHLHKPFLAGWSYAGHILCDYVSTWGQDNLSELIFADAATDAGREEVMSLFGRDFLQLVPGFLSPEYAQ